MKTKLLKANPEHEVAYQDICTLINKHADQIDALELLAIAANMLGKLIAMQDSTKHTSEEVMKIVSENIEYGNRQVLEKVASHMLIGRA